MDGSWLLLPGMEANLYLTATNMSKADAGLLKKLNTGIRIKIPSKAPPIAMDLIAEPNIDSAATAQTEVAEEDSLTELVAALTAMHKKIKALSDQQARGGETQQLAAVECELAMAKARLARSTGDKEEERKQYEIAAKTAEQLVQAQEAAYDTGTITLDRLLRGYRKRAETKEWLKRLSETEN